MNAYLEKYKGIHPGIILEREFKKRALHKRPFALSIGEHPQTLNAITKGKRKLNTALALKIEEKLSLEIIRKSLFWDTDINLIDWDRHYKAIIRRIFERGNETEKQELIHFYGNEKINTALHSVTGKPYTIYKNK